MKKMKCKLYKEPICHVLQRFLNFHLKISNKKVTILIWDVIIDFF